MPDRVYLANHGQPWKPEEKRTPFFLPGWSLPIPLDGRIEVTDQMLRTMLRPEGEASAHEFAAFVAGVYNRAGQPDWLSVVTEPDGVAAVTDEPTAESTTTDPEEPDDAGPGKE